MPKPSTTFQRAKALCGKSLPWCQDDPDLLGTVIQEFIYDSEGYMRRWAQRWYENFQFIFGNSNVRWSRKYDFAVDTDFLRRDVSLNQRASTNISWVVVEALASLIYSSLPEWLAETCQEGFQKGKRFAAIYEKILDCYMKRLNCDREFATASLAFVAFGNVGARIDWDHKVGRTMELPIWRRVKAPVFTDYMAPNPAAGGLLEVPTPAMNSAAQAYFEERWEPVTDETGRQQVNRVNTGDVKLSILTPFEYKRAIGSQGMHKTPFVEHVRLVDYDEYLKEYSELDGKTRHFDAFAPLVQDQSLYNYALRHFMRLMFTTPPTLSDSASARRTETVLKGSLFRHKVLVVEHFDKPNDEMWPEGRRVVVVNGKCTHITTPQYRTNKLDGWHPFVEAQWMPLAPSSISAGPMDSVTAKNRELNLFDSLIATAARRTMGSQLLVKIGGGLDPHKMSGEPGQSHLVSDPMTAARWLNDEVPITPVVEPLRNQIKDDVYEGSGAGEALRGERSKGVSSGYAIRQLQEREERRLTPARKAMESFASGIGEKMCACLKQNVISLDEDVMGFLRRSASGEFQVDDVVAFLSTPIDFGVDINVKSESMNTKSKATKQADLLELSKNPVIQTRLQDAEVLDEFLEYFGADKLRDGSSAHRERARRENQIFADFARLGPTASGMKSPVVIFEDDDNIHITLHTDHLVRNSEEILSNENYLRSFLLHMETHRIQNQEKQGLQAPGTAVAMPQMYAQASQVPPPNVQSIFQQSQARQQIEAQKQAAGLPPTGAGAPAPGQPGATKNPQAPKSPAPVGSKGPPQTTTAAPSQNTPSAATAGGR